MPEVSIIVPCYNEQATIAYLLEAIYQQTYPRHKMEVVLADGMSTDQTRAVIAAFQESHPDFKISVVDNPRRNIPAALNKALAAAAGEIIVRLDAHSVPERTYVATCVQELENGRADNVGGVWDIRPQQDTWVARGIAVAAAHPLGVGGAQYRYTNKAAYVDTVPFGAFYKRLVEKIGLFDETLLTNEDYEFNARIRQAGGRIWLNPAIRSVYFARPTFSALARQYLRYGYWKARMLRRYPGTLRWRQALPPLFVLGLVVLAILAIFFPIMRWLFAGIIALYAGVLASLGVYLAFRKRDPGLVLGVPLAIALMHLCWGSAFLWSMVQSAFRRA